MARRKSDSVKWTLVLVLFIFSSLVYSRPQVELSATTLTIDSIQTNKPTENSIRYSYNKNDTNIDILNFKKLPLQNSVVDKNKLISNFFFLYNNSLIAGNPNLNATSISGNRRSRVIRKKHRIKPNYSTPRRTNEINHESSLFFKQTPSNYFTGRTTNKPNIKKVFTKWTDNAKYEDFNISHDDNISNEGDAINYANFVNININKDYNNAQDKNNVTEITKNEQVIHSSDKRFTYTYNKPKPQYLDESQVYSNSFYVTDNPYTHLTRPSYIFTTPTPTPIITNLGYPQPWPEHNYHQQIKPTTRKPIKLTTQQPFHYQNNVHNNFSPYPGNNFEVATFPPIGAYTDRIVIRPEEYSASSDDCPTIFLTLNNTFQGQGQAKEACPDLNIAVNTNVINKNVVIESDEETDTTLTDVFGLPLDDESGSEENSNDYTESQENDDDTDSSSLEGIEFSNYNAANNAAEAESSEAGSFASPSSPISSITKPGRPNVADDDGFSFSSLIDFFRPAVGGLSWLAAINPLSFGALSLLLAPLILLFAGASGLAALFTPWDLSGREAPEFYMYRPKWQWDNNYKTWYVESFPNNRIWIDQPRYITENTKNSSIRSTWFYRMKQVFKRITKALTNHNRKTRKKKR